WLAALRPCETGAARGGLVALELLDLLGVQVRLLDGLPERRLARLDAAHLSVLVARTEFDVGPATGHVGRDRDRAGLARLRDDFRLALVVLGVQHFMLQAAPFQ